MYRVLTVDDEITERNVIRFLLEKHFSSCFQIEEASNGKEALEMIRSKKVDILLTDVQMPFLNGIELAKEARKLAPDMEILFFSGYDDFDYVQSALVLHAVNYVLKPLNPDQFEKIIRDILTRLDSKVITFEKSTSYYSNSFHTGKSKTDEQDDNAQSDQLLLKNIELAIQLKKPDCMVDMTNELLTRFADTTHRSHIYIRHTSMTLLQMIMGAIQTSDSDGFDAVAEQIYTLRFFSDIERIIRLYLGKLEAEMHQEVDASNYSVHRVKQYIEEHYREPLSLNLLADYVYLSPNYLSNMFTKVTGSSLNKYIRQFRMEKARTLLVSTNMKIADIGAEVGYTNTSYFIKTFQSVYGMTPVNYRMESVSANQESGAVERETQS